MQAVLDAIPGVAGVSALRYVAAVRWRNACVLLAILAGCPRDEPDVKRSNDRLDLCKDFLSKHELEAAETECNVAIAYNNANDEALVTRGLVSMVHAIDTQRTMEIDDCLTGVDRDSTVKDLDAALEKAGHDFERATKVSADYGEAWANRGVAHTLLEDYGPAMDYLTKRSRTRPGVSRCASARAPGVGAVSRAEVRRRREGAAPGNAVCHRRDASQLIGLRGFTSLVRSGKKPLSCFRRCPMTRPAGPRKLRTT